MAEVHKISVDWSLYVIIDHEWLNRRPVHEVAEKIIAGGATVIQYRNKISGTDQIMDEAEVLRVITRTHHIPFIVNDRLDIALAVEADGVHLGQGDLGPHLAKKALNSNMLLGISIDNPGQLEWSEGANYFGVGAVFPTDTKTVDSIGGLEMIKAIRQHTPLPLIGIGGINSSNAASVIGAGCDGVAVISAVLGAADIELATRELAQIVHTALEKIQNQTVILSC